MRVAIQRTNCKAEPRDIPLLVFGASGERVNCMTSRRVSSERNPIPKVVCAAALLGLSLACAASVALAQDKASAITTSSAQALSAAHPMTNGPYCEATGEVKAALDNFHKMKQGLEETDYDFWLSQHTAIEKLRGRYPNDLFVGREDIYNRMGGDPSTSGFPSETGSVQTIAEYKSLHEQHPEDPMTEYLYAITLIDRDTPTAIKLLDDVLQKNPTLPWPHQDFLRIYTSLNFLDKGKAQSNLSAWLAACPANLGGYSWVTRIGGDELIRNSAAHLRKAIGERTDLEAIWNYQTLWSLEFESHPRSEYDGLRKQVATDVARIRALNRESDFSWWYTLAQGYQLLGDQNQLKWAEKGRDAHNGLDNSSPAASAVAQWFHDHPRPKDEDSKDRKQAYRREELKQTDEWIKAFPNSREVWSDRMNAMQELDDVPPADCAATVEQRLKLEEASNGPFPLYWNTYFQFADFLSRKKVDPEREVEVMQKALDVIAAEWENVPMKDLVPTGDDDDYYPHFYWPMWKARALLYEAEGYTRMKQPDKALAALGKANLQLQALNSDITADPKRGELYNRNASYHRNESQYWEKMAQVAELEGHSTDAMGYYQSAFVARFDSDAMPTSGQKDDLGDEAHRLWAKLGGTEDGWDDLYRRRAIHLAKLTHLEWEKTQQPLPSFELADLTGKTWKPADLKGKVVFLNFWASW